jgi:gamma-glutamylcyclotransferase (GGCT)/AIG2-like uncharacterized protein YtfP
VVSGPENRVFVYGTLLPGAPWWHVVEPWVVTAAAAHASGALWDTGQGYPAATFDDDRTIHGAVLELLHWRVDEALAELDDFEDEYRRVVVETSIGSAWSYEWSGRRDSLRLIPSGRFANPEDPH